MIVIFDPVPSYNQTHNVDDLNEFIIRVKHYAERYGIEYNSRFLLILDACASLKRLLKQEGKNVWPKDSDEPITEFQDMFQLLIYGLGDNGLLFHPSGYWHGLIEYELDDELRLAWSSSERRYKALAYAMVGQNESYLKVKTLRVNLRSHVNQEDNFGNKFLDLNQGFDTDTALAGRVLIALLHRICPKLSIDEIRIVVKNLFKDHLFTQYAPLYLYYALSSNNPTKYDARDFLASLNYHNKPNLANQPQQRKDIREKCLFYHKIEDVIKCVPGTLSVTQMEFEPHRILFRLQDKLNLDFGIENTVAIAKASFSLFDNPHIQKPIDIKIKDVPIIDIMEAFYCIWKNQNYDLQRKGSQKPRDLQKSLRLLYQSGIVRPINNIPLDATKYSPQDYNNIKKKVFWEYPTMVYNNSQQMFWLVTGFIPPYDYPFPMPETIEETLEMPSNLYALCHQLLFHIKTDVQNCLKKIRPLPFVPREVYIDILKARTFFASKWNDDIEREFIDFFTNNMCSTAELRQENERENIFLNFVKEKYVSLQSSGNSKISFKSFQYAYNEIYKALFYDCLSLTGIHIYQEVFSLLSALNRSLWPL